MDKRTARSPPHIARHTVASACVAAGVPTRVLMTWGGWEFEAMLARYAHLAPREVSHYIERIAPPRGPVGVVDDGSPHRAPPTSGVTRGVTRSAKPAVAGSDAAKAVGGTGIEPDK